MIILGLTGSVGMGKSTVANMLKALRIPVFDADKAAHILIEKNRKIIAEIKDICPESFQNDKINRKSLSNAAFADPTILKKLEDILHPQILNLQQDFLNLNQRSQFTVLEVPLLFETNWDKHCEKVLLVHAPAHIQKTRVMQRNGMTEDKFASIKAKQMNEIEKMHKTDYIIPTGYSLHQTKLALLGTLNRIKFH